MINEFICKSNDNILKRVYCETQEQASEKIKIIFPSTYMFIEIIKGRSFTDFDDFIENRNYYKN